MDVALYLLLSGKCHFNLPYVYVYVYSIKILRLHYLVCDFIFLQAVPYIFQNLTLSFSSWNNYVCTTKLYVCILYHTLFWATSYLDSYTPTFLKNGTFIYFSVLNNVITAFVAVLLQQSLEFVFSLWLLSISRNGCCSIIWLKIYSYCGH